MKFVKAVFVVTAALAVLGALGAMQGRAHPGAGENDSKDGENVFVASTFCNFGVVDVCKIEPIYTVPKGKIAVIESVSGSCVTNPPTGTREFQIQFTGPDGSPVQLSFPPSPAVLAAGTSTGTIPIDVSVSALNLKSYAAGGTSGTPINFYGFASANQTGTFPHCVFAVSGQLVSAK